MTFRDVAADIRRAYDRTSVRSQIEGMDLHEPHCLPRLLNTFNLSVGLKLGEESCAFNSLTLHRFEPFEASKGDPRPHYRACQHSVPGHGCPPQGGQVQRLSAQSHRHEWQELTVKC